MAAFALAAWTAIGSVLVPRSIGDDDIALAGSILVGSGTTAFLFALLTRAGIIDGAIWLVGILSVAAIALKRDRVREMFSATAAAYSQTLQSDRLVRVVALPVAALLWIDAIAPPRDGDVMRYHLAHIRQIITDGRWEAIADYHYAFPFGWTLNYLAFERFHLPQAAALVNVGLLLVLLAGLLRLGRGGPLPRTATLAAIAFFAHPFVLRTFASALADGYAIFVVYAISLMLLELDERHNRAAILLGFACWIGAQSRYQLIAFAVAGSVVFLFVAARRGWWSELRQFVLGATGALVLSAPFYFANLRGFGNPVWPLLIPAINGTTAYANRVGAAYTRWMTGSHTAPYMFHHVFDLISTPSLIPLAASLLVLIPLSLATRENRYRRVAFFGTLFLVLWVVMEPRLFPKHVVLLLPAGAILFVPALAPILSRGAVVRTIDRLLAMAVVLVVAAATILSWDYVRYAITGDKARFHRFTWYYPVYDWANRNTPRDSRFLVVTYSGHSYYLDRPYRRADPWLSGVVDWSRVSSARDVQSVLEHGGYRYVIYDDRDWGAYPSGATMSSAIKSAIAAQALLPVHASRERLYTSRATREFEETNVYVLRVAATPATASRPFSAEAPALVGKNASLKR